VVRRPPLLEGPPPKLMTCPACGHASAEGARFCSGCGSSLDRITPAAARLPPAPPPALLAGERYELERLLGEGARKRVYLGRDTRLDREVAIALIKTDGLDEAARTRVQREVRSMARLGDHPNILTIHDAGEEGGQAYIVSQYMSGGDVHGLLLQAPEHRLPVERAVEITEQVCRALEYAHGRGVIHRDLKPSNVWLTEDGGAKLGDFGLAIARDTSRLTAEGTMVGTAAYMPPEQALGRAPDARSDLYALGAMLYELVTGRPPFVGDDAVAIISQHINTAPVAPSWHHPAIPKPLEGLIMSLLAKVPEQRPESAASVRHALAGILKPGPGSADQASPVTNPLGRLAGGIFVGRGREAEELRVGVEDALSGRGHVFLLVGEPGIGKTSIAQEVATYARLRGAQILWGRCHETGGAPAYWPWVQAMRAYVHECAPSDLAADLGSGAVHVAQVVSEVRQLLPGVAPPPALEPEQARFQLFDSVTTFLKNAAKRQPLVLVLDDLHAADKPSVLLLQFFMREIADARLLLMATYRDIEVGREHPLFQILGELAGSPITRRIPLRGLTQAEVARYIELAAGVTPAPSLVSTVFGGTEGNPFFVGEVVRLLVADGRLDTAAAGSGPARRLTIPLGVREVITHRVNQLSADGKAALAAAAVIGREFPLHVLERVSDLARECLLAALQEAADARILAEMPAAPGRYAFSHGLVHETLYDEVAGGRRSELHQRVGEVLERLYAANLTTHLPELAYHYFAAAPSGGAAKAVEYATKAGTRAAASMAHEEAIRHYEIALRALELVDVPDAARLCDILLLLAEARWRGGEFANARETALKAVEVARGLGGGERLARAALSYAGRLQLFGALVSDDTVVNLLEEALDHLGKEDSALRASAMARLAEELTLSERHEYRHALSQEAIAMARRGGDPEILASVLRMTHWALWVAQKTDERLALAREIIALADQVGDRSLRLEGEFFRLFTVQEIGDVSAARQTLERCARLAEELRQPYQRWMIAMERVYLAFLEGQLDRVEELAQQALALGQQAENQNAAFVFGVQIGHLLWLQGRSGEVAPMLEGFAVLYPLLSSTVRCCLAITYSDEGNETEARRELESIAANGFAGLPHNFCWLTCAAFLADVSSFLGDEQRAGWLYERLAPFAGSNVAMTGVVIFGPVSHYVGLLAATLRDWPAAVQHFENAIDMEERMGMRQWLARSQVAYAKMLLTRHGPGDQARAARLLAPAVETASALGMEKVVEKVLALQRRVEGAEAGRGAEAAAAGPEGARAESGPVGSPSDGLAAAGDAPLRPGTAATGGDGAALAGAGDSCLFRREGEYWTIAYGKSLFRLKDTIGLHYIAHLLRHPGREFLAIDLVAEAQDRQGPDAAAAANPARQDLGERVTPGLGDAGEMLDPQAKAAYKRRAEDLRDQLAEAQSFNDLARAAQLQEELDFLAKELSRAVGLGGRDRKAASSAERARVNVTRTIKDAIRRIADNDVALGGHLGATIKTGTYCVYTPDPRLPVAWTL